MPWKTDVYEWYGYDKHNLATWNMEYDKTCGVEQWGSVMANYIAIQGAQTGWCAQTYPQTYVSTGGATQTIYWAGVTATATNNAVTVCGSYIEQVPETDEQRVLREQRERDAAAKEAARRKRAKDALVSVLTDAQQAQLEKESCFELQIRERFYRVRMGSRVERLDPATKKIESYFCIHPEGEFNLPQEDVALSQKLLLEANETEFLRLANETRA